MDRHARQRRVSATWPALVVGAGLALVSGPAAAQATGWALDRYEPTAAGDLFFGSDFPWYTGDQTFAFRAGLIGNYAYHPLVVGTGAAAPGSSAVVSDMLTLHAQVGVALANRLNVHVALPVTLLSAGDAVAGLGVQAFDRPAVGDLRVGVRARILGDADRHPISLHLGGLVHLGGLWGEPAWNNTDDTLRCRLYLALAGRGGPLRWSFTGGFYGRPATEVSNTHIGSEVYATAAMGYVALDGRLTIGPELWVGTTLRNAFEWKNLHAEVILGAHYLIADTILVGLGGGPGLSQGAGTPSFRGLVQVAYAPRQRPRPVPPADRDHDGVLDRVDECPDESAGDRPDLFHRGCPLHDRDQDGISDERDGCPDTPLGDDPDPQRIGCPIPDTDGDGILDDRDRCPAVAAGEHPDPDRAGCPDGDEDHDGVLDHADPCRTVPPGAQPDPERPGCPDPDRDHDVVPDRVDRCPDQPGAPGPDPNRNGCPGLVQVESGMVRIANPVFFATRRDVILARSFPVLTAVADALRATPSIRRIAIEGHTDDVGNDAANLDLSQRRAASVQRWLEAHGIEASRLEAHGYGETRPLVPNTNAASRARNRRVDFRITDPAPAEGPAAAPPETPTPAPAAAPPTTPTTRRPAATPPAARRPATAPRIPPSTTPARPGAATRSQH